MMNFLCLPSPHIPSIKIAAAIVFLLIFTLVMLLLHLAKTLYIENRFFLALGGVVALFIAGYFFPIILGIAWIGAGLLLLLLIFESVILYYRRAGVVGDREMAEKLSNGDPNEISIHLENRYPYKVFLKIIEEVPFQFQVRDALFHLSLDRFSQSRFKYQLRPTERGEYHFGKMNVYASSAIGLVSRRYQLAKEGLIPVYPSYIQMRRYQLMAVANRLSDLGLKKIRRIGHTTSFEQIKEYVAGDDIRTINWKATARTGGLMVNQYAEEKAQHVYCLIDKSRSMKMPFEGMTLLDYAINASLVLSNIAIHKQDKAGLITFSEKISTHIQPDNKKTQMQLILESLYHQQTRFLDADYERLYSLISRKVPRRSLMVLFTNFESLSAMRRQLKSLKAIAKTHLLVVVFFQNTELKSLLENQPKNTEEVYHKTIAENFVLEKRRIAAELQSQGILTILTPPQLLTVNVLNRYIEIKARGMI